MSTNSGTCQLRDSGSTHSQATYKGPAADGDSITNHQGRHGNQSGPVSGSPTRPRVLEEPNLLGSIQTHKAPTTNGETFHGRVRGGMGSMVERPVPQPPLGGRGQELENKREGTPGYIPVIPVLCRIFRR